MFSLTQAYARLLSLCIADPQQQYSTISLVQPLYKVTKSQFITPWFRGPTVSICSFECCIGNHLLLAGGIRFEFCGSGYICMSMAAQQRYVDPRTRELAQKSSNVVTLLNVDPKDDIAAERRKASFSSNQLAIYFNGGEEMFSRR